MHVCVSCVWMYTTCLFCVRECFKHTHLWMSKNGVCVCVGVCEVHASLTVPVRYGVCVCVSMNIYIYIFIYILYNL